MTYGCPRAIDTQRIPSSWVRSLSRPRQNESNCKEWVGPNYEKHVILRPYSLIGLVLSVNEFAGLTLLQSLGEIGDKIVDLFEAYRKTEHAVGDAHHGAGVGSDIAMRGGRRVRHQ